MNTVFERISALRAEMKKCGIDMYYVPTDDYHGSEYVGDFFKCREYISGFTGSAGNVIITDSYAGLWTDGRYFIQAENELKDTEFVLNKMGEKGVLTASEFITKNIGNGKLGFDGKTVNASFAEKIAEKIGKDNIISVDLFEKIWKNRPPLPFSDGFILDLKYAGLSYKEKAEIIRSVMKERSADYYAFSSPDDICWLLNIRGNDVKYNPVLLSYGILTEKNFHFFISGEKIQKITDKLDREIIIHTYDEFYSFLEELPNNRTVYLDKSRLNYEACGKIPESVKIIDGQNLTLIKSKKNPVEAQNERIAHLKDGIAVTKFIYRIKKEPEKYSELSAADMLISLRKEQENYVEESFEPIIAYGAHGAIVHYSADEKSNSQIFADGFLLCDTGGHYLEGTTDVTRTVCLGNPTDDMKRDYTAVLRGHLNLADAVFRYGCHGANLDILARMPIYEIGRDFNHGTGHGVGYLLNVHEAPNGIRMKFIKSHDCELDEGMITSDEPGIYIEGKYGIRTESLLLCRTREENSFGKFMYFENLTLVPFDPDAVEKSMMNEKEISLYNNYQKRVFDTLSPYLDEAERNWLKNETRAL